MGINEVKIGILGLGYVGLPLAVEFSKVKPVVAFDINKKRIKELQAAEDKTQEVSYEELSAAKNILFTSSLNDLKKCNFYIVTVPTPINAKNEPDLTPLFNASTIVGSVLKHEDIVVYESTVFPGATEDECVPILESESGLQLNKDFFVGYSPERINPGDKLHTLRNIKKITSGSTPDTAFIINEIYKQIIDAGTYLAPSIKVAEAAKVIENTQRDVNIALINELALIFNKLELDTEEVLKAAETKWNFLSFRPGLVGGHCIGVDPYYLTYKAQAAGYKPEIILAGRKLNDSMGEYVATQLLFSMSKAKLNIPKSKILIMGLTFKENCPDIRNSKVPSIVNALNKKVKSVDIYDPWVDTYKYSGELNLISSPKKNTYDSIILAVSHNIFRELGIKNIRSYGNKKSIIYDLKYMFDAADSHMRL
jgi:UDP-N-acetyl-D-galactosamine dehydrogenase